MQGLRVVDLACGEGYGSELFARSAAEVIGVDANPEAHEHARLRYRRPNLSFRRGLVEKFDEPVDAVVFLQTIEHVHDPAKLLEQVARIAPTAYISTPNRLTLAGPDVEKSENPWHIVEYDIGQYRELLAPTSTRSSARSLPRPKAEGARDRDPLRWDRFHRATRLTKPFYDRFIPAISASDFALRPGLEKALDFVAICRS